ncbi:hypothetical protein K432DRAFT_439641 [Lepidopterella palustris CBS 459.81]|uniref:Apple domain-containing protein n=1 Tax=Lepidopterella palustris CBS 459.81 TaxID=1314670 RepID=A0A8E2JJR1_9PEZI|nr:hypothetical protein K432DRAFT_439641 [Lepidopterella palustris CBS 459.81]
MGMAEPRIQSGHAPMSIPLVHKPTTPLSNPKIDTHSSSGAVGGLRRRVFWILCVLGCGRVSGTTMIYTLSTVVPTRITSPTSSTLVSISSTPPTAFTPANPLSTVMTECPLSNSTLYTTTTITPALYLLRQCNANYGGPVAVNGNQEAYNTSECIEMCATWRVTCYGVTWVYAQPQGVGESYCWVHEIELDAGMARWGEEMESAVLVV